jgi:hypothetical protein
VSERTDMPAGTAPVMVRVLSTSAGVVRMAAIPPEMAPTMIVSLHPPATASQ